MNTSSHTSSRRMRRITGVGASFLAVITAVTFSNVATATESLDLSSTTTVPIQPKDVKVISRVKTRDKVVFITIDDGFSPTSELARILRTKKVPVTTFAKPSQLKDNYRWFKKQKRMTFENHTITLRAL